MDAVDACALAPLAEATGPRYGHASIANSTKQQTASCPRLSLPKPERMTGTHSCTEERYSAADKVRRSSNSGPVPRTAGSPLYIEVAYPALFDVPTALRVPWPHSKPGLQNLMSLAAPRNEGKKSAKQARGARTHVQWFAGTLRRTTALIVKL